MMHRAWAIGLALLGAAVLAPGARAAEPGGVDRAVERGVACLKRLQGPDGTWPREQIGATALAGLTLLECGVPADDPAIRKAAEAVRRVAVDLTHTYSLALTLLFLDRLGDPADVPLIESIGVRLLAGQNAVGGWTYECPPVPPAEVIRLKDLLLQPKPAPKAGRPPRTVQDLAPEIREQLRLLDDQAFLLQYAPVGPDDNSNTQFAALALWVARRHGLPIDRAVRRLDARFRSSQNQDGGWGYHFHVMAGRGGGHSTAPMTCAGLLGLAVSHGVARETVLRAEAAAPSGTAPPGSAPPPRKPRDPMKDYPVRAGLSVLATALGRPSAQTNRPVVPLPVGGRHYYFLWSVERVAMIYGLETIGRKDWFAWGAEEIVASQQPDGSWAGEYAAAGVDTCFALLFLRRANLAMDLTASLKGQMRDPFETTLHSGGVGGAALKDLPPGVLPLEAPAPGDEATRLSNELVTADPPRRDELVARYGKARGAVYTDALALAIPRLAGATKASVRDALADRLARMTSATLEDKLRDERPEVRRAAALACCMKDERQHVPRLIELLDDPERTVGRAAHAALKELTGQRLGPEPAAWKEWLARHGSR